MLATYDPQLVVITWGAVLFGGYADGEMGTIEFAEDAFTEKVGTQGDTVHIRSANKNGRFTVRLQQSSPTNDLLSALAAADRLPGPGAAPPMQMKDLNGTTVASAVAARIVRIPNIVRSNDSENVEWAFLAYKLRATVGGAIVLAP